MKNKHFIGLGILVLLLSGCSTFDNGNSGGNSNNNGSSEDSGYQYTAADIRSYTTAGQEITRSTSGSKTVSYYKAYDGFCVVAIANIGDSFGPVLVGEDQAQVCYYTSKDSSIVQSGGNIMLDGKTYYYSSVSGFVSGKLDGKRDYGNYFSTFTTLEDVARDIASKATFQPVDESLKNVYTYTVDNDGYAILKAGPYFSTVEKAVIPNEIDGKTVKSIASNGFKGFSNLKEVVLPSGITKIGAYAFSECSRLNRVYIPSSVTSIGEYTFYKNAADLYVFCGATSKPSGYSSNWAYSANLITYGVKNYGENDDYLYSELIDGTIHLSLYKGNEENVVIPETVDGKAVTVIGGYAFKNNTTMKSVSLPSTIVEIRHHAFNGCQLLKEIKIPYGVTTLGTYVFSECPKLERVYIPSSVTSIGEYTFYKNATDLYVFCGATSKPSGYSSNWAYSAKKVTWKSSGYIDYEDNVYNIQLSSRNLTLVGYKKNADGIVSMPENGIIEYNDREYSIISIGTALKGDTQVYSVNMPYTLKTIPDNAFDGCTNLSFVFDFTQTDVTYIGDYAFRNTKLSEMRLPRSMEYIGEGAFYGTTFNTIYYAGSKEDWESIGKSDGGLVEFILHQSWRKGSAITQVTCIGGTIYL